MGNSKKINKREFIKLDINNDKIAWGGWLFTFEDNGHIVIYIPSLNLSAYGDTFKEANEMLKISLDDFSETLLQLKSESKISKELKSLGWKRSKYLKKQFDPPYIDKNGVLKNFNLSEATEIKQKYIQVA